MKRLMSLIMVLVLVLPVMMSVPMQAEAADYFLCSKYTIYASNYGVLEPYDVEVYATNPDTNILVLSAPCYYSELNRYIISSWFISVGGDNTVKYSVTCRSNGQILASNESFLPEVNIEFINSNLLNELVIGRNDLDSDGNIMSMGYVGWDTSLGGYVDVEQGYLYNPPYSEAVGNPTYAHIKYMIDNMEDLRRGETVTDYTMPLPEFTFIRECEQYMNPAYGNLDILTVDNPNGYDVEYRVQLIGPASCYVDCKFDPQEYEVYRILEEVRSDKFSFIYPDSQNLIIGATKFSNKFSLSSVPSVYTAVYDVFNGFGDQIAENVEIEYENSLSSLFWYGTTAFNTVKSRYYTYIIDARFVDDSGSGNVYVSPWTRVVYEYNGSVKTDDSGDVDPDDEYDPDDPDYTPGVPDDDYEDIDVFDIWEIIENFIAGMGNVPKIFASIFPFMPDWIGVMLGLGIGAIVALRFLGR